MFKNKKLRMAWRNKLFYALAVLAFATVFFDVDIPQIENTFGGTATLNQWALCALALSLTAIGMYQAASRYGKANVEIERLQEEALSAEGA